MSTSSQTEPLLSPAFSVDAVSELGSEMSFESLERDVRRPSGPTAITMPSTAELEGLSFHPTYSAKGRMVLFQAEKTLFRVHAHFFIRDSLYFRDLLALEVTERSDPDATQETLVRLEADVKSVDFERLLAIMYPSEFDQYALATLDEWTSVLHLSSKWGLESIRSLALRELLPLASPVDKIVLGRKYGFHDWLTPAFVAVCARAEPLSLAEARRMHIDDFARIYEARERARGSSMAAEVEAARDAVAAVFGNVEETATAAHTDTHVFTSPVDPSPPPALTAATAASITSPVAPEPSTEPTSPELPPAPAPANEPEATNDVDDGLMDALSAWSRLSNLYQGAIPRNFGPAPSSWPSGYLGHGYSNYDNYAADYASVVAYLGGTQPRTASHRRRIVSAMLQSDLYTERPGPCVQIWQDLRDLAIDEDQGVGIESAAGSRAADIDRLFNEQCLELVAYESGLENTTSDYQRRFRLIPFLARLGDAHLLAGATSRACFPHILPPPDPMWLTSDHG